MNLLDGHFVNVANGRGGCLYSARILWTDVIRVGQGSPGWCRTNGSAGATVVAATGDATQEMRIPEQEITRRLGVVMGMSCK